MKHLQQRMRLKIKMTASTHLLFKIQNYLLQLFIFFKKTVHKIISTGKPIKLLKKIKIRQPTAYLLFTNPEKRPLITDSPSQICGDNVESDLNITVKSSRVRDFSRIPFEIESASYKIKQILIKKWRIEVWGGRR